MSYNMCMRILFLALILALTSCAPKVIPPRVTVATLLPDAEQTREPKVVLHMDTAFSPEERANAATAADTWYKQTGGLAQITLVYDLDFDDLVGMNQLFTSGANLVVRRDSDDTIVQASDAESDCEGCVLGWMNAGGLHGPGHQPIHGAFVVDRHPELQLAVMLHEFGHVLGVAHVGAYQSWQMDSSAR